MDQPREVQVMNWRRFFELISIFIAFSLVFSVQQLHAETLFLPDRCPDPCEVGGTHVSEDFQRLTTPIRIRNGDSGNYLKVDGRGVLVAPLVEDDDSFLWVPLAGPDLSFNSGISDIVAGNGFENRAYKLMNLKYSLALMSSKSGRHVFTDGTHLGTHEFWIFRKNSNEKDAAKYLLYNPEVSISQPQYMYDEWSRADISPANRSVSKMLALMQRSGSSEVSVRGDGEFGKAGFTWVFEDAPKPRDLAKLTIKNVKAISVSTGRDGNTDILLKSVKYAIEYGPLVVSLGQTSVAKGAAKGIGRGFSAGGRGIKSAGKAAVKSAKSLQGNVAEWWAKRGVSEASEEAIKISIRNKLINGAITVGAGPFRAMWWLTKTTGKGALTASKYAAKLGARAARSAPQVAKAGYAKAASNIKKGQKFAAGWVRDNPNKIEDGIAKFVFKQDYKRAIRPLLEDVGGTVRTSFESVAQNGESDPEIKENKRLGAQVRNSRNSALVMADVREATYAEPIYVSEQNYKVCKDTKDYAVPQRNPPYFRIAGTQNLKAVAERAATLSDAIEGTDSAAAWAKGGEFVLDLLMFDVTPILNEITKATDKVDDDLEIRINGTSVWPNGGLDDRKIGAGHEPLHVGVEYLFNRGDDVTINLIEVDEGGLFGSGDDSLGDLTIPTTHLYDIEEYGGAYIQKVSEGSLYEVSFIVEPYYAPTPKEVERKALHDVECAPVLAQAKAESFAREVETVRLEGRLNLLYKHGEDALRLFDQTVAWADTSSCPRYNFYSQLGGEWRVGRYDKHGNKSRDVTWTTTINRKNGVEGEIITPSQDGRWGRESMSPGLQVQEYVKDPFDRVPPGWKWGEFLEADYSERKKTVETCEIYAAMFDDQGLLGGRGRHHVPESGRQKGTEYYEIGNEISYAMRTKKSGSDTEMVLNRIAAKSTKAFKQVNFLQNYYLEEELPEKQDSVEANLLLTASGPADLWMERISSVPVTKGAGINTDEASWAREAVIKALTGSWEIGTYKKNAAFPQKYIPGEDKIFKPAKPVPKPVWTFTSDGIFIVKPEYDFWFTPPIWGNWKYIGDQRIEITTKLPVKIPVSLEASRDQRVDKDESDPSEETLGTTFIVKMAQKIDKPEEFTGFFVQDETGTKILWSKQIHPGKSPYEVPELYSDAYFDLLDRKSKASGATQAYLAKRKADDEANNAAMAAKLAELELAKSKSPCNRSKYFYPGHQDNSPGYFAFQGKWQVGQYDSRGEKKYTWDYKKGSSPYDAFSKKTEPNIAAWRTNDVRVADDGKRAFVWETDYISAGRYQQEWEFPLADKRDGKIAIRTRIGNDEGYTARYKDGEPAPPTAPFNDVRYDSAKRIFVMKGDSNWMQPRETKDFKVDWFDGGCNSTWVKLTDSEGKDRQYQANFIYHENGDKEFYLTEEDGSLYLWGLHEVDHTKYTYNYDNKILTPEQVAIECSLDMPSSTRRGGFPFTYVDENIRLSMFMLRNEGLTGVRIYRQTPYYRGSKNLKTYYWNNLVPGGYLEFNAIPNEKISFLDDSKIIEFGGKEGVRFIDRYDVCIGTKKRRSDGIMDITDFVFGKGFVREAKRTDALTTRLNCSEYTPAEGYPGRLSVVKFENKGSIPLEIWRLNDRADKISPNGKARVILPDADPYNDNNRYKGMDSVVTLAPGQSHEIKTRVGYAFSAIRRGTQRMGREYRKEHGKVMDVLQGKPEVCFGQIKISEASEVIAFSDELSHDEFRDLSDKRKKDREEEKRKLNNLGLVSDVDLVPNTVSESASAGTPVGITALAIDDDPGDIVTYAVGYPFKIDPKTGVVSVHHPLDYESRTSHTFTVTASSGRGVISTKDFVVAVEDVNEFDVSQVVATSRGWERTSETSFLSITIEDNHLASEGAPVGSQVILTAWAEDKDATNNKVRYSLSDDAGGIFAIDRETGQVKTAKALDFEKEKQHKIVVVATSADGSSSNKTVSIVVKNANDGDVGPLLDVDAAANAVAENSPAGTPVGITLKAHDPDTDDKITYKYISCIGCSRFYLIDPDTGVVKTASTFAQIDLEPVGDPYADGRLQSAKTLRVEAQSSDGSHSRLELQIEILDANEFSIEPTTDADPAGNQVAEDAVIGTVVGITANAIDRDAMATVRYRLSNDAGGRFRIDPETGIVTLAATLDYEIAQIHTIAVLSTSSDGSTSEMEFPIHVVNAEEFQISAIVDIDEAPDTVAESSWSANSMLPVGITARATDADLNSSVRYSLKGGRLMDYHTFRREDHWVIDENIAIDVKTGVISAWGLDFETSPTISFTVIATSNDGSTSESEFTIDVTNVNEYDVSDLKDSDIAADELSENARVGAYAGITASARDEDSGDLVSYGFSDSSGGRFAIDSQTGEVTLAGTLDAEEDDRHYLKIVAKSSDGSTVEESFAVSVTDVNEFDVAWEPSKHYRTIKLREDAAIGESVQLDFFAYDWDTSDTVTFELLNNREVPFAIDSRSGEVTVSRLFGDDEITSYTLDIMATSTDGTQARKAIVVPVEGVDEFKISELIDSDDTWNAVFESALGGTLVGITAFAEDRDGTDKVTYSISDTRSPFEIDQKTGVITVAQYGTTLDTETKPVETVSVVATSTDGTSSWQTYEITVSNVNEFEVSRPYDNDNTPNEVAENSPIGTVVGITAFAEDGDAGDVVTYQMGEYDEGLFAIDPNAGVVTVASPIDFETTWRAKVSVLAVSSDGMEPSNPFATPETSFEIKIIPIDEFDLTPFIDTDSAPNEVTDTADWNTPVGITVSTTDADQDLYGPTVIKFDIVDANGNEYYDQPFAVENDGRVVVYDSAKLTALGEGDHTIFVRAKSSDGSTRIEEMALTVVGPEKWYNNPQGPRVEADFPTVSDDDRQACINADEDRSSPATYNNEVVFFDCLEAAVPEVKWRDNPQGPRVEADYVGIIADEALDYCRYYDEEPSSQTYNNEKAYFDCLDPYLPVAQTPLPDSTALTCARQYGLEPEVSDQTGQVSITTGYAPYVEIQRLDADGNTELVTYLEPGQSYEAQPQRGVVYVAFDPDGRCVDAGKPRESRNSFVLGQSSDAGAVDGGETTDTEPASIQNWYDNPQDPRGNDAGTTYVEVLDADWDQCVANNEDTSHSAYNNEYAFYDCLDSYLPLNSAPIEQQPTNTGSDIGNDTSSQPGNSALACAQQNGYEPEYSDATGLVTITNNYPSYIDVQRVDPGGASTPVTYLETGQNYEADAQRGVVFVAFDAEGRCIGAGQPRESRNSYAFGG